MEPAVSVSKACFVYKNGFKPHAQKKYKNSDTGDETLFNQAFITESWYDTYREVGLEIERQIKDLNSSTYHRVLKELIDFMKNCYNDDYSNFSSEIIPCATLLTGVNQPDHITQFDVLKEQLFNDVSPYVSILYSQDSSDIKHVIENMVYQFINCNGIISSTDENNFSIKKSQCNMSVLKAWFEHTHNLKTKKIVTPKKIKAKDSKNILIVVVPNFENFDVVTLQDLITILSGYTPHLPFAIIFGVATSVSALHKTFPYHISSKLYIQVFQSHSSPDYMNKVLENIFFSEKCPFRLGESPFKLLVDIFLFYDFSVTTLIQGIKYCMMEHYYGSKISALCCHRASIKNVLSKLTNEDLEAVRLLPSFKSYVETQSASIKTLLISEMKYFKQDLEKKLNEFHDYLFMFNVSLRLLHTFVSNLPNFPLGKKIREIYVQCISSDVTKSPEYIQCMKLLDFQSKTDIINMLHTCIDVMDTSFENNIIFKSRVSSSPKKMHSITSTDILNTIKEKVIYHLQVIEKASLFAQDRSPINLHFDAKEKLDRRQLKERMLEASKKEKPQSDYDIAKRDLINFITKDIFEKYLRPANTQTYYEIFVFNDIFRVKKNLVGSSRAVIHTALTNPSLYLQCKCCKLPREESILFSLPDLSIIYKLHLECGKLINLYDWLQAFLTIVDPIESNENDDDERRDVDPKIQARFTRAVSELQFLGFIKISKRKTDHVARMTW